MSVGGISQHVYDLASAQYFEALSPFYVLQEHFYLETQATIAVPKGEDSEMELFVSTQNPTYTQVGQLFGFIDMFIYVFAALLTCTGTLHKSNVD